MVLIRKNGLWHIYDTNVFGLHIICSFRVHMIRIYPILPIAYTRQSQFFAYQYHEFSFLYGVLFIRTFMRSRSNISLQVRNWVCFLPRFYFSISVTWWSLGHGCLLACLARVWKPHWLSSSDDDTVGFCRTALQLNNILQNWHWYWTELNQQWTRAE